MSPKKILAIKLRALGDTVLMTAPLLELRRAYPDAELHALVSTPWAPILENLPGLKRVWTYRRADHPCSRTLDFIHTAWNLRKENFDLVVNFHASPASALLSRTTGAEVRSIHFHGHRDANRHSNVTVPGKGVHKPAIERDMDVIRAIGIKAKEGLYPRIFLSPTERDWARKHLETRNLKPPLLALGLGASRPTKRWPVEYFAQVAVEWCRKTGGSACALTSPSEQHTADEFLNAAHAAITRAADGTESTESLQSRIGISSGLALRQLSAVLAEASAFVGNDSGPKHVAVAVGTPTVTLFGPEDPFEWHPYRKDQHRYFFMEALPCRTEVAMPGMPAWCGTEECARKDEAEHLCMRGIGVANVLSECLQVMRTGA